MLGKSVSSLPTSMTTALYFLRFGAYCDTMASGEFAPYRAATSGTTAPSLVGKSRKRGGLSGLGDQAAALANPTNTPRSPDRTCSGVLAASSCRPRSGLGLPEFKQQGAIAHMAEYTSGRFIPIRTAPYPP